MDKFQVRANDKLRNAAKMMLDYRISSVPIVDDDLKPIDVIRKTDIANALANAKDVKVGIMPNYRIFLKYIFDL